MKSFNHEKPANRAEWIFAFVRAYRELRPEIGEKLAEVHARQAYLRHEGDSPPTAARLWLARAAG